MTLKEKLQQAIDLEREGELQQAWDVYIDMASSADFEGLRGKIYFEFSLFLFRNKCYDLAMDMLIKAYELQYDQQVILQFIDDAFYTENIGEFRALYDANVGALQLAYPDAESVVFEDLPLKFIPLSDTEFYIFDRRSNNFAGKFSLLETDNNEATIDKASTLLKNEYNACVIKKYEKEIQGNPLYVVYDSIEFYAYLQIVNFVEIIKKPNVKLFFTLADVVGHFFTGKSVVPKVAVGFSADDEFIKYIGFKNFLDSDQNKEELVLPPIFSRDNILPENKMPYKAWPKSTGEILLSFCIPTYNRGHRALESVKHVLQLHDKNIEVVVCDNGSPDGDGCYKEISQIEDARLRYYRNENNILAAFNILKVIENARGKYVFLLSDEDFVNLDAVPKLLQTLAKAKNVSALKGSMKPKEAGAQPLNCIQFKNDEEIRVGYDALMHCSFAFNYLSGAIYNRDIIIEKKIIDRLAENIDKYYAYPHLYLEVLLCTAGNYKLLKDFICLEGKGEKDGDQADVSMLFSKGAYSYNGRIAQHAEFSRIIDEAFAVMDCEDSAKKTDLYLKLCWKTTHLIARCDGPFYSKIGHNMQVLVNNAYYYFLKVASEIFVGAKLKNEIEKRLKVMLKGMNL